MTMATDTEIFDKLGFSWDRDVFGDVVNFTGWRCCKLYRVEML